MQSFVMACTVLHAKQLNPICLNSFKTRLQSISQILKQNDQAQNKDHKW